MNNPLFIEPGDRHIGAISTWSELALAGSISASAGTAVAWPAANRALFIPFRVPVPLTVYKMVCGAGATAGGNFDLGIYDHAGNLLVSSGTTARTINVENIVDITDTSLLPGMYYLAMAADTTNSYFGRTLGNLGFVKLLGVFEMETAFALPATATFATAQTAYVPSIAAYLRSF